MAALKSTGQFFHALNRQNYSRLIPLHLSQMYTLQKPVLQHFENGAFVSSIKGLSYSSVGIDEAHEMLINKDCKGALSHSLPTDMDKVCKTLEYQSKLIENLQNQLADVKPVLAGSFAFSCFP